MRACVIRTTFLEDNSSAIWVTMAIWLRTIASSTIVWLIKIYWSDFKQISLSFLHPHHIKRYWFHMKKHFREFYQIFTFWDTLSQKKRFIPNFSSQEDMQIYSGSLFDDTRSFRFNCKNYYQKWKILFCTKSMRDTKKMSGMKIVRLQKICKISFWLFFIRDIF